MSISGAIDLDRIRLREQLQIYLQELQPALKADLVEALSVEGKLLHQPTQAYDGNWALLSFYLACAFKSEIEIASGVALAIECLVCATDLFDDVMDGESTPLVQSIGMARMLNSALALLSLSQHILLSLAKQGIAPEILQRLLHSCQRAMLLATAGQQQDLLKETCEASTLSQHECIEIAAHKAGALLGLACQVGTICAGASEAQIVECMEMGRLLGIAAQLDNDAHDLVSLISPVEPQRLAVSRKSDLERGKKTLPVVLAAHSLCATRALDVVDRDTALRWVMLLTGQEREVCLRALHEGILATWGIALLYRERARDCLHRLECGVTFSQELYQVLGLVRSCATTEEW